MALINASYDSSLNAIEVAALPPIDDAVDNTVYVVDGDGAYVVDAETGLFVQISGAGGGSDYCPDPFIINGGIAGGSLFLNEATTITVTGFALDQFTGTSNTSGGAPATITIISQAFDELVLEITPTFAGNHDVIVEGTCSNYEFSFNAVDTAVIIPGSLDVPWVSVQDANATEGAIAMVAGQGNGWNRGARVSVAAPDGTDRVLKFTIGAPQNNAFGHIGLVSVDTDAFGFALAETVASEIFSMYFPSTQVAQILYNTNTSISLGANGLYSVGDEFEMSIPASGSPMTVSRNGVVIGTDNTNTYSGDCYIAVTSFRNSNFENIELCYS